MVTAGGKGPEIRANLSQAKCGGEVDIVIISYVLIYCCTPQTAAMIAKLLTASLSRIPIIGSIARGDQRLNCSMRGSINQLPEFVKGLRTRDHLCLSVIICDHL